MKNIKNARIDGVGENELLYDPKTTLLFGDAKASLTKVVSALKAL